MKTNLDEFKTNPLFEKEGVQCDMGNGRVFTIRRVTASNPRMKAAMARFYKPYARLIEMDALPPEKLQEINVQLFLEVCLAGWSGILDGEGKEIPYSREVAAEILKSAPDLFDTLWKFANNFENYRDDVGNS